MANHGNAYTTVMKLALNSNTIDPGQSVAGSVFFEGDKKARLFHLLVLVGGAEYEFPFSNP